MNKVANEWKINSKWLLYKQSNYEIIIQFISISITSSINYFLFSFSCIFLNFSKKSLFFLVLLQRTADISATILETTSNLNDQPDNGGVHDGIDAVCSTDGVQSCDKNEEDEVVVEENQLEQDQYDEEVEKEEEYYIEDEERSSQGCEQMFTIEDEVDCEDTNPENDADQVEEVFAENVCFKDNQQQQQQKEEKVKSQEDLNELHTSDVVEIEDDLLDTLDFDLESSECCSKDIKALPREEDEALPNDNVLHLDVNSTIGDDRPRFVGKKESFIPTTRWHLSTPMFKRRRRRWRAFDERFNFKIIIIN